MGSKRGTIDPVIWVWVVVIVLIAGAVVVVAVGRGGELAPVYDDRPDVTIPSGRPLTSDDLRDVRFTTAVRGYRMDEVDALLARVRADLLARESRDADPDAPDAPDDEADVDVAAEPPSSEPPSSEPPA